MNILGKAAAIGAIVLAGSTSGSVSAFDQDATLIISGEQSDSGIASIKGKSPGLRGHERLEKNSQSNFDENSVNNSIDLLKLNSLLDLIAASMVNTDLKQTKTDGNVV